MPKLHKWNNNENNGENQNDKQTETKLNKLIETWLVCITEV